jgi:hypothetical protein
LRRFKADPGAAFVSVIRTSNGAATLGVIREHLIEAGATKAEVNAKWKTVQPLLSEHPNIIRPTSTGYSWSDVPGSASKALASLSKPRKLPDWLRTALAETIAAALDVPGDSERSTHGATSRVEGARALAEVACYMEQLVYDGAGTEPLMNWLRGHAADRSLEFIGRPGETLAFDPNEQVAMAGNPQAQSKVTVVRPGAFLVGEDSPVLISRALVRPN